MKFKKEEISNIRNIVYKLESIENENYRVYVKENKIYNIKETDIDDIFVSVKEQVRVMLVPFISSDNFEDILYKVEDTLLIGYKNDPEVQEFIKTCREYILEDYDESEGIEINELDKALQRAMYYKFISKQDNSYWTLSQKADWLYTACEEESEYKNVSRFLLTIKNRYQHHKAFQNMQLDI